MQETDIRELTKEIIEAYQEYSGSDKMFSVKEYITVRKEAAYEIDKRYALNTGDKRPKDSSHSAKEKIRGIEEDLIKPTTGRLAVKKADKTPAENTKSEFTQIGLFPEEEDTESEEASNAFSVLKNIKDGWN